jgi:hypothetical protein
MNFSKNGLYSISSNSTIDTIGYIYNNSFDRLSPSSNLLAWNDDGPGDSQFGLLLNFKAHYNYILVVTTYAEALTGRFFITARGPGQVVFYQLISPGMSQTNVYI